MTFLGGGVDMGITGIERCIWESVVVNITVVDILFKILRKTPNKVNMSVCLYNSAF